MSWHVHRWVSQRILRQGRSMGGDFTVVAQRCSRCGATTNRTLRGRLRSLVELNAEERA